MGRAKRVVTQQSVNHSKPRIKKRGATTDTNHSSKSEPLESQISAVLWEWKFTHHSDRGKIIHESNLALLLEYWFPFTEIALTRKLGTWCDGIPFLRVTERHRTGFLIAGVGYFPNDLSPFELRLEYSFRRDSRPEKIELRFGIDNTEGSLKTFSYNYEPTKLFKKRPTEPEGWAVVVEIIDTQ